MRELHVAWVTRTGVRRYYSESGSRPAVFWHTGSGGDGTRWRTAGYLVGLPGLRATMVGYSGGANLIYALAARHPERVAVVVGIGGVPDPQDSNAWRREAASEVRQIGFPALLERMSASESEQAPTWPMENLAATPTEMLAIALEAEADAPTAYSYFKHIQAPTLILCGELADPDGAADLAVEALPAGRAVVLPGFGHLHAF